jgi:tetratricopeptide (TPR) repeat protein
MRVIFGAALSVALAGCTAPRVVRVIEGREVEGTFISSTAYAFYARAMQEEAFGGDAAKVLAALKEAAREDPESAEIWTRIGAVTCRDPYRDTKGAEEAIERARAIDPEYAPSFREQARCALLTAERATTPAAQRQRLREALAAAEQAFALDPDDLSAATLLAELLARAGRDAEARRLLAALVIQRPSSIASLRALYEFGRAHGEDALTQRAGRWLRDLGFQLADGGSALPPLDGIDAALGQDDLSTARRLAHKAHLPLSELAVRAAALGRIAAARSQAEIIIGADPSNTSARIALAVALDLGGDMATLHEALAAIPAEQGALVPPSPLARLLFAELLDRRVGPDAARAFLGPFPGPARPGSGSAAAGELDALRARIEQRVLARFDQAKLARASVAR